ncbi:MAG: efflux RND transporter periplasmic adaptor subunit [Desulfuromonadales bacterium]|nr:efflux RND transporter periplasmic adaptor subunit [Desulfuromonadales bacterium]
MKKILLPLLIIIIGVALTALLIFSRSKPQPKEAPHLGPLVNVVELELTNRQVVVSATGTVQPQVEANIAPQVNGRVSEMSPQMIVGGIFREGELMFAIEEIDYRLALDMAQSKLAQTELELARNENLAELARNEWQRLEFKTSEEPSPLLVYEPQLKSARAQRDAALASLEQAKVNLQRCRVLAPFNGYIRSESVGLGQYLKSGSTIAAIAGIDQAEIIVPLPLDQLAWINVPRANTSRANASNIGSSATVELTLGNKTFQWQGEVTRSLGEIDPRNRMAKVVVTVDDPLSRHAESETLLSELLPGMFVEVHLHGELLNQIIAIPRSAVHDKNTVRIVDAQDQLHIRNIEIVRYERDDVLVRSGVSAGERLVTTGISGAADGMKVRSQLQGKTP